MFNDYLREAVEAFDQEMVDVNAMLFDAEAWFRVVWSMPEAFGLTDLVRYRYRIGEKDEPRGKMGLA